jgi:phage baseplate assembly protein W
MIEQMLFTNHGERVNRPDFGSGLLATHLRAQQPGACGRAALQHAVVLATLARRRDRRARLRSRVEGFAELRIAVKYVVRRTGENQTAVFARTV